MSPRLFLLVTGTVVLLLWGLTDAMNNSCTYFGGDRFNPKVGDRRSGPEINLANCSWFGANACCKRTEVTSVFSEMQKLYGATEQCDNRLSYLMCYFCSPEQEIWLRE